MSETTVRSQPPLTPQVLAEPAPVAEPVSDDHAAAAIQPLAPRSAVILPWPGDTTRHYMLAARLQSVHAMNPPKSRARRPAAAVSTTKPLPKRQSPPASAPRLKPQRTCAAPRVQRPERPTAKIIHLAQRRDVPAAESIAANAPWSALAC